MSIECEIKEKFKQNAVLVDKYIFENIQVKTPNELYEASLHLIKGGGKRLRPYLVSKSCEIVGGDIMKSIPFGAALELLHTFTLVHDDIMDNDNKRRGIKTVHNKYQSKNKAILVGDLLYSKVYDVVLNQKKIQDVNKIICCMKLITNGIISLNEGQYFDIMFPDINNVSENEYIKMVSGKTAVLFKVCAEVGSIIGGGNAEQISNLGEFAYNIGIGYGLLDDILGITGDEKKLGKPIGSDLREGKKTLIIIHALNNSTVSQNKKIKSVLGNKHISNNNIFEVNEILETIGSLEYSRKKAKEYVDNGVKKLKIFQNSVAKSDLEKLAYYFIQRTY